MIDLPGDDNFLRYASRRHIVKNELGAVTISSSNFLLRQTRGETYLSGAWYEFLKPENDEDGLIKAIDFMKSKRFAKVNGAFSLHNVAQVIAKSDYETTFRVCQLNSSGAYSGIFPQPTSLYKAEALAETINKVLVVALHKD